MDYVVYELYLNNTVEKQKQNEDIFQAKRCIGKKKILKIEPETGISSNITYLNSVSA